MIYFNQDEMKHLEEKLYALCALVVILFICTVLFIISLFIE